MSKRRNDQHSELPVLPELRMTRHTGSRVFKPKNQSQERYLNKIENNTITFGVGPAGTGKTFVAAMAASAAMRDKSVEKIIITRPVVEAGEQLGFLPGDLKEKYAPYVQPFVDALTRCMGSGHVEALLAHGKIEFLPLAFMRGHSWDNTFVVLDEAQNITQSQMKLFLTRIGNNTKVIVDGDLDQKDLNVFGLDDAIQRLAKVPSVAIHEFTEADIVRSGIVRHIISAYGSGYTNPATTDFDDKEGLSRFIDNS
jgi:phosphate starvation-inducible protein PhoH and related proteins